MDPTPSELHSQAEFLATKFIQGGTTNYIDEAISIDREALKVCPPGHSVRPVSLNSLSFHLWMRYRWVRKMEDLNEAIVLNREALALLPVGHTDWSVSLNNLAVDLSTRYKKFGAMEDLNEAIVLGQEALAFRPVGHPDRSMLLNNLAVHLSTRYNKFEVMEDLNEAIVLDRESLALRPVGHPDRSGSLNNLTFRLSTRYKKFGAMEDLSEAIVLGREALGLCPVGHPNRSGPLNNLAIGLSTRYDEFGAMEDLNEAIVLDREALALRPVGHPDRSMSLNNLAVHLFTRYNKLRAMEDLNEAIVLGQEVLTLCPVGHPNQSGSLSNLAVDLSTRYKKFGEVGDLNEAIVLNREALALCPVGHPDRSVSLENLANHLRARFTQSSQLDDKQEIFSLFATLADVSQTTSSIDLSAARSWIRAAEDFHHPTTLLAYQTSLRLLVHHLTALPSLPRHLTIFKSVASSLAVEAFSACLRNHSPTSAVELLEQGRGVFWDQLTRLHSPLDDVTASGPSGSVLADEFMRLASLIRDALSSPSTDQHDRVCGLNFELQSVINRIRMLPGLSRFLLPLLFSDLRQAACKGPVVVINASKYGCDTLIVLVDHDPVHIPLSITHEDIRALSSKLSTVTERAKYEDVGRDLRFILRTLWDTVVSPIVDFLRTICPLRSRIWWCPTAEFTSLPLHAAAPFRKGEQSLADLYISSYTSTLTALIRARRRSPSRLVTRGKSCVAIGQGEAVGEKKLVSVSTELAIVGQQVHGLAAFTRVEGAESSISRVTEELHKNEWVHFACHGLPNREQPFESAFALHDGRFTIQRITQCDLENPEFAYLSACHTTVGDEESPDEVIHLASAMQFAGFRSVIGTMWAVDDDETNKITSMFYGNMKDESGQLNYTRAAFALNKTMRKVRIPLDQRVLYIHLGA